MTTRTAACQLLALGFALLAVRPAGAASHVVRNTDGSGDGSLREAVAGASAGDTVLFASAVRGTIALEEPLDIDGLKLTGPGADVVTVRGSGEAVLRLEGTVSISGLTIAGADTAIAVARGKATLLECAVRDSRGAGISIEAGDLTVVRSQISGNGGVGIASVDGNVFCVNSTVAENGGAGIRADDGSIAAASCTVAHNRGAGLEASADGATAHNTLLADNLRACDGPVRSRGYNLVDDESCGFHEAGDLQSPDVRVAPLAANGGRTETMALTGGSPAVDAGDPAGCVDSTGVLLTVDQRGGRRPAGSRCDIGAYEQPVAVTGTVVNRIVALVDGDPITMHEVRTLAASDPRLAEAARTDEAGVLDLLITDRIVAKEIQAQDIKVADSEIDRYIATIRQRNNLTEEQLDAALAQQGLTRERYRAQIRAELERAQLIKREISGKVTVSPEDIERYHKAQGGEDETSDGEEVSISHIVLQIPSDASPAEVESIEARADKIYEELEDGANFAEVAKKESEDGSASSGGKLGSFKKGELREELAEAIADLDPGEYARPVKVEGAIHIVRLDERVGVASGGSAISEAAREEIKEKLYSQALEERYARWLREDLRQKHSVELLP